VHFKISGSGLRISNLSARSQTLFGNAIFGKAPALREAKLQEHVSFQARAWELYKDFFIGWVL
jgi:hypothetical protein